MDDAEAMGAKFLAVEANQPLFVFAEGDGTWGAVYQGTAGRISKDNVRVETDEMASERRTAQLDEAVAGFDDDANELDDSDEEEDEEEEDAAEVDEEPEEAPSNGFAEEDFIDHEAASAAAVSRRVDSEKGVRAGQYSCDSSSHVLLLGCGYRCGRRCRRSREGSRTSHGRDCSDG
jgi:hypothetical protein